MKVLAKRLKRLFNNKPFLIGLHSNFKKCKNKTLLIKKIKKKEVYCISEICLNILNGCIILKPKVKLALSKCKDLLRFLVDKNNSWLLKKKKLLSYGCKFLTPFITCIMPIVLEMIKE